SRRCPPIGIRPIRPRSRSAARDCRRSSASPSTATSSASPSRRGSRGRPPPRCSRRRRRTFRTCSIGLRASAHHNARWLFPAPAVLLVAVIIVYPIVYTGWMSLHEWFASSLTRPRFIGLANYANILLGDARFHEAVAPTISFPVVAVAAEPLLGVAMALLFNREFWGRGLLRTMAILPIVAAPTAIALVSVVMSQLPLAVPHDPVSLLA